MNFTKRNINRFLLLKLPSAYFTGVRLESLSDETAVTRVTHRWINGNPFRSLYFGVQAMAAEIATGVLVLREIHRHGKPVSMLVTRQSAVFVKKAKGTVRFICREGGKVQQAVAEALHSGEGQVIILRAYGTDRAGDTVSEFEFEWSIKSKTP